MKRYSEVVLDGHPDRFCDLIADNFVRTAYGYDPEAYAQVEASVWSDQLFLTGSIVTRNPFKEETREIILRTGDAIGYTAENYIDVRRYVIHDHICKITDDPRKWTHYSNDQSIVTGWAGYDEKTGYLPPEHWLCWQLRDALIQSIHEGALIGHGPDGKVLVIMKEERESWILETILTTMQQKEHFSFVSFTIGLAGVLQEAYARIRENDRRWTAKPEEIRYLVNPNGPLLNGGSDGDNGQTGRKLVMDFYGPRVPIGGGALHGKDFAHIDRLGAMNARRLCMDMVKDSAREAFVSVCFGPGMEEALSVSLVCEKKPKADSNQWFGFWGMRKRSSMKRFWSIREIK
jgi:S-adenosylmethionine synthetase